MWVPTPGSLNHKSGSVQKVGYINKTKKYKCLFLCCKFAPSVCVVLNGGPELDLGMGDNNKIIISGHVIFDLLFFWGEGGGLGLATRRVFQKYFLYIGVYS